MNGIESYSLSHDAYYTETKSFAWAAIIDKLLRLFSFTVFSENYVTIHVMIPLPIPCEISMFTTLEKMETLVAADARV